MSLGEVASVATAVGVVLVAAQLVLGRVQTRTALEDELTREYREIAPTLTAAAFFDCQDAACPLPAFRDHSEYVRYLDPSNQQVFLRMQRRVSSKTWRLWSEGIEDNLRRPAFEAAWTYVRRHSSHSYQELASCYGNWHIGPPRVWWRRFCLSS